MNKLYTIVVSARTLDAMNQMFDKDKIGVILSHCLNTIAALVNGEETPSMPYLDDYKTHSMMKMCANWIIEDTLHGEYPGQNETDEEF